jgi:hypothetical protein
MTDQLPQRELDEAIASILDERGSTERYRRAPGQARRGRAAADRPRPLEFDANGFPVAQRMPNFVTRVSRLLSP